MQSKRWFEQNEKAGNFWLYLSYFLVSHTPKFIIDLVAKIVSLIYFLTLKNERENIKEYRKNLASCFGDKVLKNSSIYTHFNSFACSICDKIAVWCGKIKYEDLSFEDEEFIYQELLNQKMGQILLVSHFGNVEISRALVSKIDGISINILTYDKNAQNFNNFINKISKSKVKIYHVDELDISSMLHFKTLLENGEHIAIMGDRIPINGSKFLSTKFLGKEAKFNIGAYLIAGLLGVKISTFWCIKTNGKFHLSLERLSDKIVLLKDKQASVKPHLERYVKQLELKCEKYPAQWYNFFDFWRQ
ncbi:hypothetical protein [Campylobacter geochelonis]|uniref:Glycosyl transferase, group 2 family protein n=1 Tax=Campylobacter geochelonis TaxID=1780362 RepID=A0A128EEZ5_9BACT|nr:hypothetical protein [Campylobacter geochelonis]QKF71802.1 lysophospholipid acyltransferase [Campylobacter geochelonis]CZE47494.1 glycosyl transferase%2C group 2 family protein [Campylobacter geochelonis]